MDITLDRQSAIESGQVIVAQLLQEPVKDAVREALSEEAVTGTEPSQPRETADESGEGSKLGLGLALVVVAGVAYAIRRRGSDNIDQYQASEPAQSKPDEGTAAGDRSAGETPVSGGT